MTDDGLHGDLVLVRHGQTRCTLDGRFCGAHEGVLTAVGHEMARLVATHPALDGVTKIVASPAGRALATAAAVADAHGEPVEVDDRLCELSFGEWEDQLPGSVDQGRLRRWSDDPAVFSPPGGETGLAVLARAVTAVRDALLAAGSKAVVVTHKAPVRLVLSHFLGLPPSRYRDIGNVAVGSLSHLRIDGPRVILRAVGDVSHLPAAWRSAPDRAAWTEVGG